MTEGKNEKAQALPQTTAEALAAEDKLAEAAAKLRGEGFDGLTHDIFLKLWPLLRAPIPPAFIVTVGRTEGKPYPSTGIKSVQVQIDRLNNVLTPFGWRDDAVYQEGGKLCKATVEILDGAGNVLLARSSYGGVGRGSSAGNIYKGSYTNAMKLAIARIGVGHEIYCGAADMDPDVSADLAKTPAAAETATISKAMARKLVDKAWEAGESERLRLAASRLIERDVGDCDTKAKAARALEALDFEQAGKLETWLDERAEAGK